MIKAIVVKNQRFEYPDFLFEYLEAYFDEIGKSNLSTSSNELVIPNADLKDMIELVKKSFRSLVKEKYQVPTHKHKSKYPSRYQKVEFEGAVYVVDYRKDNIGKLIYALDYLLAWLQEKLIKQD